MRLVVRTSADIRDFAKEMNGKFDGKPYTLTLEPFKRPRTLDQNALVHSMIRELAIHTGYSDTAMKDIVKAEFGPVEVMQIGPRIVEAPKSTAAYTIDEMSALIEQLHVLASEVGCVFQLSV